MYCKHDVQWKTLFVAIFENTFTHHNNKFHVKIFNVIYIEKKYVQINRKRDSFYFDMCLMIGNQQKNRLSTICLLLLKNQTSRQHRTNLNVRFSKTPLIMEMFFFWLESIQNWPKIFPSLCNLLYSILYCYSVIHRNLLCLHCAYIINGFVYTVYFIIILVFNGPRPKITRI